MGVGTEQDKREREEWLVEKRNRARKVEICKANGEGGGSMEKVEEGGQAKNISVRRGTELERCGGWI